MAVDKEAIGYSLVVKDSKYFLNYNYKGYGREIEIQNTYLKQVTVTYDELRDEGDIAGINAHGLPYSTMTKIGTFQKDEWRINNHAEIKNIIENDLNNNVFGTQAFKDWSIQNHRMDTAKSEVFATEQDLKDTHSEIVWDEDKTIQDQMPTKTISTAIDGSILVMEK